MTDDTMMTTVDRPETTLYVWEHPYAPNMQSRAVVVCATSLRKARGQAYRYLMRSVTDPAVRRSLELLVNATSPRTYSSGTSLVLAFGQEGKREIA